MTDRRALVALGGLVAFSLACFGFVLICPHSANCIRSMVQAGTWVSDAAMPAAVLVALTIVAWAGRTAWLLNSARASLRRLPLVDLPDELRAAQARTRVRRMACIAGGGRTAFCAGLVFPRVFVGDAIATGLSDDELDAVLLHEKDHADSREPLRRAARQAAAEVLFYAPVVKWWAQRRIEDVELQADRAATVRVGRRALAAALWTVVEAAPLGTAAFAGAAALRLAQLTGDPVRRSGLPPRLVAISLMGGYLALRVLACAVAPLSHIG